MKHSPYARATLLLVSIMGAGACSSSHERNASAAQDPNRVPAVSGMTSGANAGPAPATPPKSPLSGGLISVGEPTRAEYCAGSGPPVSIQLGANGASSRGGTCTKPLASQIFQFGLCTCEDAVFTGSFSIDALSSSAAQAQGHAAASVGVDGQLGATGALEIDGSLIAAGGGPMPIISGDYQIDGNFECSGDLSVTGGNIRFGRDLWVDGDITAIGVASVKGDVHLTPGHSASGMAIGGQQRTETFSVPIPCACAGDQILDIDAIVAAGKASSHNADLGLGDDALFQVGSGPIDLECGRFAFPGGDLVGDTLIEAHGRTALFIDGDLVITGSFGVDLGTSGELDVFVTGDLVLTGAGEVGSQARPAALRFYVGGAGDIAITGANHFAANLYAPRAAVTVTGADDIYGSFFVGSYLATGAQRMHYDAAILDNGDDAGCKHDCSVDLECESPSVCHAGGCVLLTSEAPF